MSSVISPFSANTAVPARGGPLPSSPTTLAEGAAPSPRDTVARGPAAPIEARSTAAASSGSSLTGAKRAGAAVMLSVALLGAGAMAPSAAHADWRGPGYGYGQNYYHRDRGSNFGGVAAGVVIGTVLGAVISNATQGQAPPVIMQQPPVIMQQDGYNAPGCDGQMHHWDNYGNVADGSGHYQLMETPYGCQAGPPR